MARTLTIIYNQYVKKNRQIILLTKGTSMTTENSLATDLNIISGKEAYDKEVKTLLANRQILAIILKAVVNEFQNMELSDIVTCIETPEVGERKVHPGQTNEKIYGKSNENNIIGEGTVTFDIVFDVYISAKDDTVKMIINIEAQRENNPGYELVTRGIYYTAREISSQYGREFTKSEYNSIKKVYSIWICVSPNRNNNNGITEYFISEKSIYNNTKVRKEVYDKLCVVMIYLKKNLEEESEYIINFLSVLLSEKIDYDRKVCILEKDLGLSMTEEMKEEVNNMCNLSEHVYESGIEKGTSELIRAIQFIREGNNTLKELTAKGIPDIIAEKAINLGIK